ncbi:hypothetical protein Tco_0517645 [Tanacetum coccineum]
MLDQTFDRLQNLVSQLELLGEKISQEDVNKKLLKSLSPAWNTYAVMWRNKADLDTMSMDDLYNNLKVYKPKVKWMSSSSSSTQNMAFVSSSNNNTSIPPPYTGNFMPPTPDLSFTSLDEFVNKPVVENRKSYEEVSGIVRKNNDAPIIEEWVSDSEEENVSQPKAEEKTVKPSIAKIEFVKPKQQEKTARKTIKQVEKRRQNTHIPRGNQINWNNMMSQRLGSNF